MMTESTPRRMKTDEVMRELASREKIPTFTYNAIWTVVFDHMAVVDLTLPIRVQRDLRKRPGVSEALQLAVFEVLDAYVKGEPFAGEQISKESERALREAAERANEGRLA